MDETNQLRLKLENREKMYQAALAFIILILLFYICGYIESSGSKLMLK
jgi:hypothetical protein